MSEKLLEELFRKYYNIKHNEKILKEDVLEHRKNRFLTQDYWKIWKENGEFFAFLEGFFHKQNGNNMLSRLTKEDIEHFSKPSNLISKFKNYEELSEFFFKNNIKRMRNTIAKDILKATEIIIKEHNGKVPKTRKELMEFNGYGRKISNMFLNLAYDIPVIAVDIRVYRSALKNGLLPKDFDGNFKKDKYKQEAEKILTDTFKNSIYLIEVDYLLFQDGGKDR